MKIFNILCLIAALSPIAAQGSAFGLFSRLGHTLRPQAFKAFAQKAAQFKNSWPKMRAPLGLAAAGAAQLSFDEQVKQKEKEIKKEVRAFMNTLKYPIRITENSEYTARMEQDTQIPFLEQSECRIQGFCVTQKAAVSEDKKSYSSTVTGVFGARQKPVKESPKHKMVMKSLTLYKYGTDYATCFADLSKAKKDVKCKALMNVINFDPDESIIHRSFKADLAQEVTPEWRSISRCTTHLDGSRECETFEDAYIII